MYPSGQNRINETQLMLWSQPSRIARPRGRSCGTAAGGPLRCRGGRVAYTYIDIGPVAGLPNMYESSWGPPGKLLSAVAEGLGALLALAALGWALAMRRRATRAANAEGAPWMAQEAQETQAGAEEEGAPRHRR